MQNETTIRLPYYASQEQKQQIFSGTQSQLLRSSRWPQSLIPPTPSPNICRVSTALSTSARRKKRTSSGTLKEGPRDESLTIQTQSEEKSLGSCNNSSIPITLSDPQNTTWKWNTSCTSFAVLKTPTTPKALKPPSTNGIKHQIEAQTAHTKRHKREHSLLDWKDMERFDILNVRQIR